MVKEHKFIDANRIAASGVSYGGYVVGMMLAETSEESPAPIRCGVAVSPVVEWRYYGKSELHKIPGIYVNTCTMCKYSIAKFLFPLCLNSMIFLTIKLKETHKHNYIYILNITILCI